MSDITKETDKRWPRIEQELNSLKEKGVFPLVDERNKKEITFEERQQAIEHLKKEIFTISVCGVVKAGKSTFLNAVLFGDDILPTFATPMTAKLTFIEYTDKPNNYFTVHFYSKEEFKAIKDVLKSQDDNKKSYEQFMERLEYVGEQGETELKWVGHAPIEKDNLDDLFDFVADPNASINREQGKGLFTPFVKEVHIYVHNESIKNVRIVDTPGLRDSNIINSRETLEWIDKTHAIIFILQNKGITSGDVDFLLFDYKSNSNSRIFVINQIDKLNDPATDLKSVIGYMRKLGNNPDYKSKNLFGSTEKIYGYSALGVLLDKMLKNGLSIEKYQEDYDLIQETKEDNNFDFDPDNIEEKISTVLYQNQGRLLIESGKNSVLNIYDIAINNCNILKPDIDSELDDLMKSSGDLDKDIAKTKTLIDNWNEKNKGLDNEIDSLITNIIINYQGKIFDSIDYCFQDFNKDFRVMDDLNIANDINSKVANVKYDIKKYLVQFLQEMQKEVSKIQNREIVQAYLEAGIRKECAEARLENFTTDISIDTTILEMQIKDCVPSNWFVSLFSSVRGRSTDLKQSVGSLKSTIKKQIESAYFTDTAKSRIVASFRRIREDLIAQLNKFYLEKMKNSKLSKEEKSARIEKLKREKGKIIDRLDSLENARRKFDREII